MKQLITITIDAPSHNDINYCNHLLQKAILNVQSRVNNGARIRFAATNGSDIKAMQNVMGDLKWWALGRMQELKELKGEPEKPRGWFQKFLAELNGVLEVED